VAGASDGGGVERRQVRGGDGGPARRLEVDGHQLFLHQHHEGTGVLKAWGGGGRRLLLAETPTTSTPLLPGAAPAGRTPLGCLGALHGEEVHDAGGEVERGQGLALQHADAVPVAVAGPRHPPAEDDEGVPGGMKQSPSDPGHRTATSPQAMSPQPSPAAWGGGDARAAPPAPRGRTPTRRFARGFC